MIIRHFMKPTHRARTLPYVLGHDLPSGSLDPRTPHVLLGDPLIFAHMAQHWNPYTMSHYSCVLSLSELIDESRARKLSEEFFDILVPGRRPGQCLTLAVLHRERGRGVAAARTGIHCFVLSSDLLHPSRKLDVYWPARDKRRLETWQELVNLREGFSSAKEPTRKREIRWGVSPKLPEADSILERFQRKLKGLSVAGFEDTEEFASSVALAGGVGVRFDRTPHGRLRARFAVQYGSVSLRISAVAPVLQRSLLRRSSLKDVTGSAGFERTPQFLNLLRDSLIAEIEFAAHRREPRHGLDRSRLSALRQQVATATLHRSPPALMRDETNFGFPKFAAPQIAPPVFSSPQAVDAALPDFV